MRLSVLRLGFAGLWVLVAVGLWVRPMAGSYAAVAPLLALAFAALNVARWRQGRRRAVERRRPRPASGEHHPEFDFGGPSRGG